MNTRLQGLCLVLSLVYAAGSSSASSIAVPSEGGAIDRGMPLSFSDLYVLPAGPKGLEYTETLRALDGQRVCLIGCMVRETNADPDVFLFAAVPVTTYACESLAAADLPPQVVQVMLTPRPGFGAAWRPRPLEVSGRLELGPREERDGRISYVRVHADQVLAADTREPLELQIPLTRRVLGDRSQR